MVIMKKAYLKDGIKMFKKNLFRLISIILILTLGNAFFIGMNAVSPVMEYTAEEYMKKNNVYDITLVSNLGYKEEDLSKWKTDGVSETEGVYTYDVLTKFGDRDIAVRVASQKDGNKMNKNEIYEGRDIQAENECLVCSRLPDMYEYEIGDTIKIYREEDKLVEENLKISEFKIVGKAKSPIYLSTFYGNTELLTGDLSGFIIVKDSVFKMDNYTALYIKTTTDNTINKFSDEYKEKLEKILPRVETINKEVAKEKYDKIYKENFADIQKAEEEIIEAEKLLTDSYQKIKEGQLQVNSKISTIAAAVANYYNSSAVYDKINNRETSIKALYRKLETLDTEYRNLEEQCANTKTEKEKLGNELDTLEKQIDKNLYEMYSLENEETKYVELNRKTNTMYFELNTKNEKFQKMNETYEQQIQQLKNMQEQKEQLKQNLETTQQDLYTAFSSIQDLIDGMNNIELTSSVKFIQEAKENIQQNVNKLKEKNAENEIKEVKEKVKQKKEDLEQFKEITATEPLYKSSGFKALKDDLEKIKIMGRIFPVMFFVVAALVTITTITRMIEEDRKNIGTLKALGYSKNAIMKRYIVYALIAALMGTLLGAIIGSTMLVETLYVSYCSLYDLPNMELIINWGCIAITLLLSLVATVFVTVIITQKSLKESTASLMRPKAAKEGKNIFLEKVPVVWGRLDFLFKISFRNIFRYKRRLFMTLIGIAGCTALIYAGLSLQSSINSIGSKQFSDIKKMTMEVYLKQDVNEETVKDIEKYIKEQNNITDLTPVNQQTLVIEKDEISKDIFYIMIDAEKADTFNGMQERKSQKKIKLNDDGVVLTEKLAGILKVKEGDKVTIKDDGISTTVKVTGITENYLYNFAYFTPKMYERIHGTDVKYNEFFVNMSKSLSKDEQIAIGNKLKENEWIASIQLEKNFDDEFLTSLNSLMSIVILFIGCAGLLSFTVLINLNNINIEERTRELATIKLLGFYKKEIESYVFRENIILTLLGTILGLGLGMGILGIIIESAEVETIFLLKDINYINLGVAAAMTILFTLITNFFMKRKLKRINMTDSLKSIE